MSEAMRIVWLVAAILVSTVVIVAAFRLSRPLADLLGRGLKASSITASQTLLLARLLLLGLAVIISQALLRGPIALVFGGGDRSAAPIESGIAAAALGGVLVLLVWAYQTARPMVQAMTLRAIDAAIPTTGQAVAAEPTRTSASVISGPVPSATDAVTIVAPLFARPPATDPTIVAGRAADATVVAGRTSDATVVAGHASEATPVATGEDATAVSHRSEAQQTIVGSLADEKTLRIRKP
jgi:hypothetical protein